MTAAVDAYEVLYQSAYGVWQIVEFDLSSGQAPTGQTKQQLKYVVATLGDMFDEINDMAVAAKILEHHHIISDVNNIKIYHGKTLSAAKTLLESILKSGQPDYNALTEGNAGFDKISRLIDCIRREIQVITGGQ